MGEFSLTRIGKIDFLSRQNNFLDSRACNRHIGMTPMFTIPSANPPHFRLWFLGFAAVSALAFNLLAWDGPIGFGFVLFTLIFLAGFITLAQVTRSMRDHRAHMLLVPIALFTASIALYNNDFVAVAPAFVCMLSVLYVIWSTVKPESEPFGFLNFKIFRQLTVWFEKIGLVFTDVFKLHKKRMNIGMQILGGLVIALPILTIFIILFREADPIFNELVKNILTIPFDLDFLDKYLPRIIHSGFVFGFLAMLFYVALGDEHALISRDYAVARFNNVVTLVVLSLVTGLFAVFTFVQFKYMFMTPDGLVASGISFAEAARSGFFQLTWVLIFASVLLGAIYRSYAHHAHSRAVKYLLLGFIVLIALVALSALRRMNLYQDEFGFTISRLYVAWLIYGILIVLAYVFGAIIRGVLFRPIVRMVMVLFIAGLSVVSIVNIDRMVAKENIDRFLNREKSLDMSYLNGLSIDALPEIQRLYTAGKVSQTCANTQGASTLSSSMSSIEDTKERVNSWRSMNMGVIQSFAFQDLKEKLKQQNQFICSKPL